VKSRSALAADVWRQIFEFFWASREEHMKLLSEMGLTPGHMKALFDLDGREARPMGSLATSWNCDASNVTWIVDRLEERGLVERRALPADRRVKAIALTALGEETKAKLLERMYEPPEFLFDLPRADLEALSAALSKLPPSRGPLPLRA
jgi:DNA-binding MarR family transcriptional regulator